MAEVLGNCIGSSGECGRKAVRENMKNPVVVEHIKGHFGLDIGDTLIGMHIKHVAVPVRLTLNKIGQAHLTAARYRPKLIGGARAVIVESFGKNPC